LTPQNFSLVDDGSTPTVNVRINFQTQTAPVPTIPTIYFKDYGQPYGVRSDPNQGSGWSYGWIDASGAPLDLSLNGGNGRDRGYSATGMDQRLDTLLYMQGDDFTGTFPSGVQTEGKWEIAVPNGTYLVTVSAGDPRLEPTTANESYSSINVEGINAIYRWYSALPSGSVDRLKQATISVFVTDGKLTVDALSGFNSKINYIDITAVTSNAIVFPNLTPSIYTVKELVPLDWLLSSINCSDPDSGTTVDLGTSTATIDLDSNENITCTFNNSQDSNPPTRTPTPTATPTKTQTPTPSQTPTATTNPLACSPRTPNECSTIPVFTYQDFCLTFDGDAGGLHDTNIIGTGFTMVDPNSVPVFDQPTTYYPAAPSYAPTKLRLFNDTTYGGQLWITSTKGSQTGEVAAQGPSGNQAFSNGQVNGLGVGFDAKFGKYYVETTINKLDFTTSTTNQSQQAGIWFGLTEDNYAKLVILKTSNTVDATNNTGDIQLTTEQVTVPGPPTTLAFANQPTLLGGTRESNLNTKVITLRLIIDPTV
ncbi:MAG TPA: hypothetical protein VHL11_14240, partial [Phototrophicaceae bacterium]|nr:hypothetical protein [Phototrophicaceae bacterium]